MKTIISGMGVAILSLTAFAISFAGVSSAANAAAGYVATGARPIQVTCTSRIWASSDPVPDTFPEPEKFTLDYKFMSDGSFASLGGTARAA